MTAEFQAAASPNVQMFPGIGQPGLDTNQYVSAMQDNLNAVARSNEAVMYGLAHITEELFSWANTRVNEGMRYGEMLMKCRQPQDLMNLQVDAVRTMAAQNVEETRKILDMVNTMAAQAWQPYQQRADEIAGTVQQDIQQVADEVQHAAQ